jgi:hypothetical protein
MATVFWPQEIAGRLNLSRKTAVKSFVEYEEYQLLRQ